MKKFCSIFICCIAIWLTSCGIRHIQYDNLVANVDVQGTKSITVAVLDHRDQVVKEGQSPDFVGYRLTILAKTKSRKPLADDAASSICQTLSGKGFKCSAITTTPKDAENDVISKLKASNSDISMLFLINSWLTESQSVTLLFYRVTIDVYNKNGDQLLTKEFKETKKFVGANVMGPEYKKQIPAAFKKEMEKMLNDADIKKSLQ